MRGAPVQSFGRRTEPEDKPAGPVVLPPVQMPPVQLPVVLVVDVESLAVASQQIAEMVEAAVRAGFVRAVQDIEAGAEEPPVGDPDPSIEQLDHIGR